MIQQFCSYIPKRIENRFSLQYMQISDHYVVNLKLMQGFCQLYLNNKIRKKERYSDKN